MLFHLMPSEFSVKCTYPPPPPKKKNNKFQNFASRYKHESPKKVITVISMIVMFALDLSFENLYHDFCLFLYI